MRSHFMTNLVWEEEDDHPLLECVGTKYIPFPRVELRVSEFSVQKAEAGGQDGS
jgi:hypothetical protein